MGKRGGDQGINAGNTDGDFSKSKTNETFRELARSENLGKNDDGCYEHDNDFIATNMPSRKDS